MDFIEPRFANSPSFSVKVLNLIFVRMFFDLRKNSSDSLSCRVLPCVVNFSFISVGDRKSLRTRLVFLSSLPSAVFSVLNRSRFLNDFNLGICAQALQVLLTNVPASPTREQPGLLNVPTVLCTVPSLRTVVLEACGSGYQLTSPLSSPGLVSFINSFGLTTIFPLFTLYSIEDALKPWQSCLAGAFHAEPLFSVVVKKERISLQSADVNFLEFFLCSFPPTCCRIFPSGFV